MEVDPTKDRLITCLILAGIAGAASLPSSNSSDLGEAATVAFGSYISLDPLTYDSDWASPLCVRSNVALDIDALNEQFVGKSFRFVKAYECSTQCIDGYERLVAPNGEQAFEAVAHVGDCTSKYSCEVTVGHGGSGAVFRMKSLGDHWRISEHITGYMSHNYPMPC